MIRAILVVRLSFAIARSRDLALSQPTKARRTTAGSAPPIYRVSKSRKAFFAHPLGFGYHTSQALTISLDRPPETPFRPTERPVTGSNHGHSTVDVNRLPGDIGRLVRAEIDGGRGDFIRRSEPGCRNLRKNRFALFVVERIRHRGCDKSRRDAVGGDIALGVFRT